MHTSITLNDIIIIAVYTVACLGAAINYSQLFKKPPMAEYRRKNND